MNGREEMKKLIPYLFFGSVLLLTACGTNMKKTLTADGGKWKVEETRAIYTFYDDGKFSANDSKHSVSGTYTYDEKNKLLSINLANGNSFIIEKIEYKDTTITGKIGEKERTLVKEKTE